MTNKTTIYVCSHCDAQYPKWQGRCTECGKWNTIDVGASEQGTKTQEQAKPLPTKRLNGVASTAEKRIVTSIKELNTVLGGGFVVGSITLLGGEPGIGKSTLSLQIATSLPSKKVLYISAEESVEQLKLRAERLGGSTENLFVLGAVSLEQILATIEKEKPDLVIVDSVQTITASEIPSAAGSVAQVRYVAERLSHFSRRTHSSIVLIGHVTKEGVVAGPRTLEHLVDAVLYLEGNRYENFRMLRGVKNRFGSTGEVGVFEMKKQGLVEVQNPSKIFLDAKESQEPGSAVFVTLEGKRAFLGVVQALVTTTNFGYPKRAASGFQLNRLQLLVAVLTKKAGLDLDDQDIYIKTAGGLSVDDPALDLPVCLAIASSFREKAIEPSLVAMGEVGLSGEIRTAQGVRQRMLESEKLGFKKLMLAEKPELAKVKSKIGLITVSNIDEAIRKSLS